MSYEQKIPKKVISVCCKEEIRTSFETGWMIHICTKCNKVCHSEIVEIEESDINAIKFYEQIDKRVDEELGVICSFCQDEGFTVEAGHANTPHENGNCDGSCPIQEQEECQCGGIKRRIKYFFRSELKSLLEEMKKEVEEMKKYPMPSVVKHSSKAVNKIYGFNEALLEVSSRLDNYIKGL